MKLKEKKLYHIQCSNKKVNYMPKI